MKGENWFLLLHAGAPGTDMKRVPQCPSLNLKLYILGTVPASYTLYHAQCHICHSLCAPHQALCSSHLVLHVYPDVCSMYCVPGHLHLGSCSMHYVTSVACCTLYYIRSLESHVHRYQVLPLESVCHRPCPGSINGVTQAMILICSTVAKQTLGQFLNSTYRYLCNLGKVTSLPNASVSPTIK